MCHGVVSKHCIWFSCCGLAPGDSKIAAKSMSGNINVTSSDGTIFNEVVMYYASKVGIRKMAQYGLKLMGIPCSGNALFGESVAGVFGSGDFTAIIWDAEKLNEWDGSFFSSVIVGNAVWAMFEINLVLWKLDCEFMHLLSNLTWKHAQVLLQPRMSVIPLGQYHILPPKWPCMLADWQFCNYHCIWFWFHSLPCEYCWEDSCYRSLNRWIHYLESANSSSYHWCNAASILNNWVPSLNLFQRMGFGMLVYHCWCLSTLVLPFIGHWRCLGLFRWLYCVHSGMYVCMAWQFFLVQCPCLFDKWKFV